MRFYKGKKQKKLNIFNDVKIKLQQQLYYKLLIIYRWRIFTIWPTEYRQIWRWSSIVRRFDSVDKSSGISPGKDTWKRMSVPRRICFTTRSAVQEKRGCWVVTWTGRSRTIQGLENKMSAVFLIPLPAILLANLSLSTSSGINGRDSENSKCRCFKSCIYILYLLYLNFIKLIIAI